MLFVIIDAGFSQLSTAYNERYLVIRRSRFRKLFFSPTLACLVWDLVLSSEACAVVEFDFQVVSYMSPSSGQRLVRPNISKACLLV